MGVAIHAGGYFLLVGVGLSGPSEQLSSNVLIKFSPAALNHMFSLHIIHFPITIQSAKCYKIMV